MQLTKSDIKKITTGVKRRFDWSRLSVFSGSFCLITGVVSWLYDSKAYFFGAASVFLLLIVFLFTDAVMEQIKKLRS
jgi:hypothetical protein